MKNKMNKPQLKKPLIFILSFGLHLNFCLASEGLPNGSNDSNNTADVTKQTYQLDFDPYISSYLPLRKGELFFLQIGYNQLTNQPIPLIERFDLLRTSVLNKNSIPNSIYGKNLYKSTARGWEGVCNQWSAASLQPQINKILFHLPPISCGGVTIYPSEITEIFTAFFNKLEITRFLGKGTRLPLHYAVEKARELLGKDDVDPKEATDLILENLKLNKGVVADFSNDTDVWNHPIYKIDAVNTKFQSLPTLVNSPLSNEMVGEILQLIPPQGFSSTDESSKLIISSLKKLESELNDESHLELRKSSETESFLEKVIASPSHLEMTTQINNQLIKQRELLLLKILQGKVKVDLMDGYSLTKTDIKLLIKSESSFARSEFENSSGPYRQYSFITLSKNKVNIESRWMKGKHFDFVWTPQQIDINSVLFKKSMPLLDDLITIIKKCQPTGALAKFYKAFNRVSSKSTMTQDEADALLKLASGIENLIDIPYMSEKIHYTKGTYSKDAFLNSLKGIIAPTPTPTAAATPTPTPTAEASATNPTIPPAAP